jgi:hypothetical protein
MKSWRWNFCRNYFTAKRFLRGLEGNENFSNENMEDCKRALEGMFVNYHDRPILGKINYDIVPTNLWGELSMKDLSKKIVNTYNELNSNLIK